MRVEFVPGPRILTGLAEISYYLRVSKRTAHRWITQYSLPAFRFPSREFRTSTTLIDLWILTCMKYVHRTALVPSEDAEEGEDE